MRDFTDELRALRQRLTDAERYLDIEGLRKRLASLEADASRPDLWDDADTAWSDCRQAGWRLEPGTCICCKREALLEENMCAVCNGLPAIDDPRAELAASER